MIYNFDNGDRVNTELVKGDSCIILGKEYPYIGEISDLSKLPSIPLYYIWKQTGVGYRVRHAQGDAIGNILQTRNLMNISKDDKPISRPRFREDVFHVPVNQNDNRLKLAVKLLINDLHIDLRDYKNRFGTDEASVNRMNNMRRLITSDANLTFEKFEEWLNILGASCEIIIKSPNGKIYHQ